MIPFALLSSETGRHWEWTSLFYLIFWIPSVITVLVVPRLFSTHLAPRCFSATPTKTPLWAHVLIWPIGIVGAVAWLLFLAIVVATWSSDPLIK